MLPRRIPVTAAVKRRQDRETNPPGGEHMCGCFARYNPSLRRRPFLIGALWLLWKVRYTLQRKLASMNILRTLPSSLLCCTLQIPVYSSTLQRSPLDTRYVEASCRLRDSIGSHRPQLPDIFEQHQYFPLWRLGTRPPRARLPFQAIFASASCATAIS